MKQAEHYIRTDPDDIPNVQPVDIARVKPAKPEDAVAVLNSPTDTSNGRSDWVWVRLRDGTLLLATFPEGDTYMQFSDAGVCDFYD